MAEKSLVQRWRDLVDEIAKQHDPDLWRVLLDAALDRDPEGLKYAIMGVRPTPTDIEGARRVLQRDYVEDVQGLAADLLSRIVAGEINDRDGLMEAIDQDVDSQQRVIYTQQAMEGLVHGTQNAEALLDDYGADALVRDENINWAGMMAAAMIRDVQEELGGDLLNSDDPRRYWYENLATSEERGVFQRDHRDTWIDWYGEEGEDDPT